MLRKSVHLCGSADPQQTSSELCTAAQCLPPLPRPSVSLEFYVLLACMRLLPIPVLQLQARQLLSLWRSEYAEAAPIERAPLVSALANDGGSCQLERTIIDKQNNFRQAGDRFRSWDSARQARRTPAP